MMEWKSVGMMTFPTEWKVIGHAPNHQPVMDVKHKQRLGTKKVEHLPLDPLVRNFGWLKNYLKTVNFYGAKRSQQTMVRWTATLLGCSAPSEREPNIIHCILSTDQEIEGKPSKPNAIAEHFWVCSLVEFRVVLWCPATSTKVPVKRGTWTAQISCDQSIKYDQINSLFKGIQKLIHACIDHSLMCHWYMVDGCWWYVDVSWWFIIFDENTKKHQTIPKHQASKQTWAILKGSKFHLHTLLDGYSTG